jgi:divinyl protochlorophyllide a 8-vinyl-reductase
VGRIGPNAIIRMAEAVTARHGAGAAARLFLAAGLSRHLVEPPSHMVDEAEVIRLHVELRAMFGLEAARDLSRDAGRRTADYLLAHRIPKPMRALLPRLPARIGSRILLAAVARHAWTFAGSGHFSARPGRPVRLRIRDCPLCRGAESDQPLCEFYAATFERLFRVLVHPDATGRQTSCQASGAPACEFEIRW